MKARKESILAAVGAALAGLAMLAFAGAADAGGGGGCGCTPPPSPPSPPCCRPPNINVNIPGVTVNVGATVLVNAGVQAQVGAFSGVTGNAYYSGGGAGGYLMPGAPGLIQGLNVEGGLVQAAYEATRTRMIKVVVEAVCLDDKDVPHPASQVTPDRDIDEAYDGEIYRCIAGTRLQYTYAEFNGQVAFDHGTTVTCEKGEALYHTPGMPGMPGGGPGAGGPAGPGGPGGPGAMAMGGGASLECRPQKPARDCNERSLLRRFGTGVKVLTMITEEKYTAYRQEQTEGGATTALSLDGGVGGVMY